MFIRDYKTELELNLEEWYKKIISHWMSHGRPFWTDSWEKRVTRETRANFEFIVATTWIMQGAKGCTCYKNSPVLQDWTANYFLTKGSIEACDIIIKETLENADLEPNFPITRPRKLLI